MATVSESVPVRNGSCNLWVHINGCPYQLRRVKSRAFRTEFTLLNLGQNERRGMKYHVGRRFGVSMCTCKDFTTHLHVKGFRCKHINALTALGLLSGRKPRPSEGGGR